MAKRLSWDQLSPKYQERLLRNGIGPAQHAAGASIAAARGKGTESREAFGKRVTKFLTQIGSQSSPSDAGVTSRSVERQRIMAMGPVKGQDYMDYRRAMIARYEGGRAHEAQAMFQRRDLSVDRVMYRLRRSDSRIVDATWWYHGIFGG
jgi:hypothetical protein